MRMLTGLLSASLVVMLAVHAMAEGDGGSRSVLLAPSLPEPAETSEPLDLSPVQAPIAAQSSNPGVTLKTVNVPLPPRFARSATPAIVAEAEALESQAPQAALTTTITQVQPETPVPTAARPLQQQASLAPSPIVTRTALPAFVLQPSTNPALPPGPGTVTLPTLKAPAIAQPGGEDEEEEGPHGGSVETQTEVVDVTCLQPELLTMVRATGNFFRAIPVITSGYRSRGRAGSLHRRCMAADFIVPGVAPDKIVTFLRTLPGAGGIGTYCHNKIVHLDTGEPRNWGYCGFRRTYFSLR